MKKNFNIGHVISLGACAPLLYIALFSVTPSWILKMNPVLRFDLQKRAAINHTVSKGEVIGAILVFNDSIRGVCVHLR